MTLNSNLNNHIIVREVTTNTVNVVAGGTSNVFANCLLDGYTPMGIVSEAVTANTNGSRAVIIQRFFNTSTTVLLLIRNTHNTDITGLYYKLKILYQKNL